MYRLCVLPLVLAGSVLFAQAPAPQTEPAKTPAPKTTTPAPAGDHVVISVGSEKVTVAEFEALVDALPAQLRAVARGNGKRMFAEQLANMKTLAQEARKQKLDQKPEFKKMLAFQEENLLAGNLFQSLNESLTVDEAEARKYYDDNKGEYESAQARHILIRTKGSPVPLRQGQTELSDEEALTKARELRKRLEAGESFEAVAKAESDDTGSGANGGDLGKFKRGQMVGQFESVAFTQPLKEITQPVKTQFGYHLIRVDSRGAQTFEEVREQIVTKLRPQLAKKKMEEIRKQASVTLDDSYFGPAAPAQPGPPAGN